MGYVKKLTDKLVSGIMENIPYTHYTGDPVNRLPGTASFVFEAVEGEGLILRLDFAGICGSTGSGRTRHPARSTRPTCSWQSVCRTKSRTAPCV